VLLFCHSPLHEGMLLRINSDENVVEVLDDDESQSVVRPSAVMN